MNLKKEDYESYRMQVEQQLKVSMMTIEAHQKILEWLDKKIGKKKKK